MKVFLKNRNDNYDATAKFNYGTKELILLKGSRISETISGGTFRSAKTVEKLRNSGCIKNRILVRNITFKSASAAANFVTGSSTNGMVAWKDENGNSLKNVL